MTATSRTTKTERPYKAGRFPNRPPAQDEKKAGGLETTPPWLLRQTRIHFPRLEESAVKIRPIEKGGSDRKFYRVRCSPEQTIILVKYNLDREENRHYVEIAEFLADYLSRVLNRAAARILNQIRRARRIVHPPCIKALDRRRKTRQTAGHMTA